MLLRHTDTRIHERKALTINPAKTCQPVGAMYAALGIHGCFPHSHGSQGCCAYHRSALTRHYKEPVMAGSSSFTEGSSVFGGQSNLLQAIENIFSIYNPEIIAVHTTCLSETIGDDIPQIIGKARNEGKIPADRAVIYANTPSYVGSHVDGFANMAEGIVRGLAEGNGENNGILNIIPGWVEPSDMREIRRILSCMGTGHIMLPDTSGVLDAPQTGIHEFFPSGGTTMKAVKASGKSSHTLALGDFCSSKAAEQLKTKCGVNYSVIDTPLGISASDRFLMEIAKITGRSIPESITEERGRVMDIITDMHQYLYGKRVALFGDPDMLIPLAEFLIDLDMIPAHIVSGTPGKRFEKRISSILHARGIEANIRGGANADLFLLHQWMKNDPVDLLIGNSYGKYIARDEGIPFLRMGFPILDRIGHSYFPCVGYTGAMRILEKILNLFLDRKDRDCPETAFELVM